jgi:hypothetical protein
VTNGTLIFATGNNLKLYGDMLRRGLIARLDAGVERPELRAFTREDPVHVLKRERGLYVTAALTALHAYNVAGRSRLPETSCRYQYGSQSIRGNHENYDDAARFTGAATAGGIGLNRENEEPKWRSSGRTLYRAGFRRENEDGLWEYMALPEAWRTDITKGHDARALARAMVDRRLIISDSKRGTPAQASARTGVWKALALRIRTRHPRTL